MFIEYLLVARHRAQHFPDTVSFNFQCNSMACTLFCPHIKMGKLQLSELNKWPKVKELVKKNRSCIQTQVCWTAVSMFLNPMGTETHPDETGLWWTHQEWTYHNTAIIYVRSVKWLDSTSPVFEPCLSFLFLP